MARSSRCWATIPRVMRSQAVSARLWYMSWAAIRATLAHQVVLQPLARDPLELAEQVQLRVLARVAPLGLQESPGEVEDHGGGDAFPRDARGSTSTPSPTMPSLSVLDGPHQIGG